MIVNMIEIVGQTNQIEDLVFKFTITDMNDNITKDYSQGISFADLWNEMDDDTKKKFVIKFIMENIYK
jgi:hypothetical protein